MKNKKKFLRTSISALVVVATVLISVVATIKYKEDYDEEKRFNYIRENVEKSSEEKILYNLKKKNKDIVGYIEIPNTTISYPVLQTTDEPDFYLNHDIYKRKWQARESERKHQPKVKNLPKSQQRMLRKMWQRKHPKR